MTREEILAMKPGLELNIEVAENIIGSKVIEDKALGYMEKLTDGSDSIWDAVLDYSGDISAADIVVNKMILRGYADAVCWADFGGGIYTEPEAICKAALIALLESP